MPVQRRALDWQKLWPFIAGAAFGVPAGVALLTWSDPRSVRIAVGIILILYSLYAFFRPALKFSGGGRAIDGAVGFLNGVLGGLILVTIWRNLHGWPKDVQRTVFQPVAVAIFLMSAIWLGAKGTVTAETAAAATVGLLGITGAAIPPRGDMPKNRVLFSRKDAACLLRSPPKNCLA